MFDTTLSKYTLYSSILSWQIKVTPTVKEKMSNLYSTLNYILSESVLYMLVSLSCPCAI